MATDEGTSELARASDPSTPEDELGKLSFSADPQVVDAVVANPNTPQWAVFRAKSRLSRAEGIPASMHSASNDSSALSARVVVSPSSRSAVSEANAKANGLMAVAATLSIVGIIGSILVGVVGLFLLGEGDTRPVGIVIIALGLTGVLIWVFIGSFAQAVAAGVKMLAAMASDG